MKPKTKIQQLTVFLLALAVTACFGAVAYNYAVEDDETSGLLRGGGPRSGGRHLSVEIEGESGQHDGGKDGPTRRRPHRGGDSVLLPLPVPTSDEPSAARIEEFSSPPYNDARRGGLDGGGAGDEPEPDRGAANKDRKYGEQGEEINKRPRPHAQPHYSLSSNSRIIGGYEAAPRRHPFAVSLDGRWGHFCGGSLIVRDVILTAAHCGGGRYEAVLGRPDLDNHREGQVIATAREAIHPDYDEWRTDNDFMLVFLRSPAKLNEYVGLIGLNAEPKVPRGGEALSVVGWGDTDSRDHVSRPSNLLMEADVAVITNEDCARSSGFVDGRYDSYEGQITSSMLCARESGRDSCQGDSGGPLLIPAGRNGEGPVQAGVVSWGLGCALKDFPGVYARVSAAYGWIEGEACRGSDYAEEAGFDCGEGGRPAPSPGGGDGVGGDFPSGGDPGQPSGSDDDWLGLGLGFGGGWFADDNDPTYFPTHHPSWDPTMSPSLARTEPTENTASSSVLTPTDGPTRSQTQSPTFNERTEIAGSNWWSQMLAQFISWWNGDN